eukprot:TRINITY_DN3971_c0_g1_i1.p1 TRINITY_DN3971_c0_g1~~TRINITY_DN3971_c0_g1_i1.p1  ORF type:complete len:506 (+),score=43.74 TRINITY_DN3971_c0_g1_i1:315-1832(+)
MELMRKKMADPLWIRYMFFGWMSYAVHLAMAPYVLIQFTILNIVAGPVGFVLFCAFTRDPRLNNMHRFPLDHPSKRRFLLFFLFGTLAIPVLVLPPVSNHQRYMDARDKENSGTEATLTCSDIANSTNNARYLNIPIDCYVDYDEVFNVTNGTKENFFTTSLIFCPSCNATLNEILICHSKEVPTPSDCNWDTRASKMLTIKSVELNDLPMSVGWEWNTKSLGEVRAEYTRIIEETEWEAVRLGLILVSVWLVVFLIVAIPWKCTRSRSRGRGSLGDVMMMQTTSAVRVPPNLKCSDGVWHTTEPLMRRPTQLYFNYRYMLAVTVGMIAIFCLVMTFVVHQFFKMVTASHRFEFFLIALGSFEIISLSLTPFERLFYSKVTVCFKDEDGVITSSTFSYAYEEVVREGENTKVFNTIPYQDVETIALIKLPEIGKKSDAYHVYLSRSQPVFLYEFFVKKNTSEKVVMLKFNCFKAFLEERVQRPLGNDTGFKEEYLAWWNERPENI